MPEFSEQEKKELLAHARQTLNLLAASGRPGIQKSPNRKYLEKFGVIVSLLKNNNLRSEVGNRQPTIPIWDSIIEHLNAALEGYAMFAPIEKSEISQIKIKISILVPAVKISKNLLPYYWEEENELKSKNSIEIIVFSE